jgi:hypothetical protein
MGIALFIDVIKGRRQLGAKEQRFIFRWLLEFTRPQWLVK